MENQSSSQSFLDDYDSLHLTQSSSTGTIVVSTLDDEEDGDTSAGNLSLREAIALANSTDGTDEISFDSNLSSKTITLTQGELTIEDSVTINGLGAENLTISGNNSSRVFKIDDENADTEIDVTINGLTITDGNVDDRETDNTGGGVFNQENLILINDNITDNRAEKGGGIANQGNLTIQNSNVDNNYAFEAGGIYTIAGTNQIIDSSVSNNESNFVYGGILASGVTMTIENSIIDGNSTGNSTGGINISGSTANINNSTISNNSAQGFTGGISSGGSTTTINNSTITGNSAASNGGIQAGGGGALTINNSTITGNSATVNQGGGVTNYFMSTVTLNNSTITGNFAARGAAGVYQRKSFVVPDGLPEETIISGTLNLNSTIVAGNENNQDLGGDSFNSGGNNLIGNGEGFESFFDSSQNDLVGTADNPIDPLLGQLQDNGGITQTIALLDGSPAIDAGNNLNNLATDQRGDGFDRTVGNGTDIGAFEVQEITIIPVVTTLEDEDDGDLSTGDISLREAILFGHPDEKITFDSSLSGGTITLALGELVIDRHLVVEGLGAENLTIDGNNSSRVFKIDDGDDNNLKQVSIDGLTITGGNTDQNGGGIESQENLILSNSIVANNFAGDLGGGIHKATFEGNLKVINTVVTDNTGRRGGGIQFSFGNTEVLNSTLSGNVANTGGGIDQGSGGNLKVVNSTIANNTADTRTGGGIYNGYGEITVTNSTITGNTSSDSFDGGGIANGGQATITSSIIANNSSQDLTGEEFTSGGNNLIGNGDSVNGFTNGVNGDIVGTANNPIDPLLGQLQDNGGVTQTIALLDGSPAIDAGSNPDNLATDQRGDGFDRTIGNGTDIGAFEVQTISNGETIIGTAKNDFLLGSSDNDTIEGLEGNDFIKGLDGDDLLNGGSGNDFLQGGNGNDEVNGDANNDLLQGGNGDDVLRGGDGNDRLFAGNGMDTLDDGAGNDILFGGGGSDRFVNSNPGNDLLTGGGDADYFIFNLNAGAGFFDRDRILDFKKGTDAIGFRPVVDDAQSFDNFDDLDTNGSGILDKFDERIDIIGGSTVIDFSDLFGRSLGSDTITIVGETNLGSDDFLFATTI
ncbi:MAG: hypothetical protein Tsb0014_41800 [Pleurocapsa sp.]